MSAVREVIEPLQEGRMTEMVTRGIRGATTVTQNNEEEILKETAVFASRDC